MHVGIVWCVYLCLYMLVCVCVCVVCVLCVCVVCVVCVMCVCVFVCVCVCVYTCMYMYVCAYACACVVYMRVYVAYSHHTKQCFLHVYFCPLSALHSPLSLPLSPPATHFYSINCLRKHSLLVHHHCQSSGCLHDTPPP